MHKLLSKSLLQPVMQCVSISRQYWYDWYVFPQKMGPLKSQKKEFTIYIISNLLNIFKNEKRETPLDGATSPSELWRSLWIP